MGKQRAAPNTLKPLKPARELASMVTKLPKEERLKLEGYVLGLTEAHKLIATDSGQNAEQSAG